jgi:hypothetical protein
VFLSFYASVRKELHPAAVVCVKESGMKENWCLATSRTDVSGKDVVKLYGKRFTTEENFRDTPTCQRDLRQPPE